MHQSYNNLLLTPKRLLQSSALFDYPLLRLQQVVTPLANCPRALFSACRLEATERNSSIRSAWSDGIEDPDFPSRRSSFCVPVQRKKFCIQPGEPLNPVIRRALPWIALIETGRRCDLTNVMNSKFLPRFRGSPLSTFGKRTGEFRFQYLAEIEIA